MKQDTYTLLPDDLCREIGANAAVICAKVITFTANADECTMDLQYLANILQLKKRAVQLIIRRLHNDGYIEYKEGRGRGCFSVFKKGVKLAPFLRIKGAKNVPFLDAEKVQNFAKKGAKKAPFSNIEKYNKNIIKENNIKESANACELRDDSQRCARENRRNRIELLTRDEVHARFGTTAPTGWCMLLQRDNKGWARWADTAVAKAAGLQIEKEF